MIKNYTREAVYFLTARERNLEEYLRGKRGKIREKGYEIFVLVKQNEPNTIFHLNFIILQDLESRKCSCLVGDWTIEYVCDVREPKGLRPMLR